MRQWHLLMPDESLFLCEHVAITPQGVIVNVRSVAESGVCPNCAQSSTSIHSHYQRTVADLPWQGERVLLKLSVRKFFCRNVDCSRAIFTERLPQVAAPHARQTQRLVELLRHVGISLGGQGGARLAQRSGISRSPSSLLRMVRCMPLPAYPSPAVVGVDDWAYRRGHHYGSIVCDLERHRPLDLLPERSAESLAQWLRRHPHIHTISRDRGDEYIRGATLGAPQAIQVADRFHLLQNLRDALARTMDRHRREIGSAAKLVLCPVQKEVGEATSTSIAENTREKPIKRREALKAIKRQNRYERFQKIQALFQQGVSQREIAKQFHVNRETVGRYVHSTGFLDRASPPKSGGIIPYIAYLQKRWQEGCRVVKVLFQELRTQGFRRSIFTLYRFLAPWRCAALNNATPIPHLPLPEPSSKLIAIWILKHAKNRKEQEQAFLQQLSRTHEGLKLTIELATSFVQLMRSKQVAELPKWFRAVHESTNQTELKRYAKGLRNDLAAVEAAITLPWSNGQVEGQVNRLKLIKRQMYGRGKFDLLRCRFLGAA